MQERERALRGLCAALLAFTAPPFRQWARGRARELERAGELGRIVVWFGRRGWTADELEAAGEPEFAVQRADGSIERSPYAPPDPENERVVLRRAS